MERGKLHKRSSLRGFDLPGLYKNNNNSVIWDFNHSNIKSSGKRCFVKLFEPIIIRGMKLKNRILMEPMEVGLGYRSRKARAFYVERAQGGVGAIVAPGLSVDLLLYDDTWGTPGAVSSFIEGLKKLTEDIHREDCKIGLQLFHAPRFPSGTGSPKICVATWWLLLGG